MKNLTKTIAPGILMLLICTSSFAQKGHDRDEAKVTISINGKEQDIEEYFEEWGERFERKMERMFDDSNIHIDIDDDDFDISFNNVKMDIDEFVESIAEVVTKAVTNMTIELKNIDPDEIDHNDIHFNGNKLEDLIDEIEDKYDSKVENIDNLKMKIREDYVKIDIDVTLKNGKKISKSKIYED